MGASAKGTEWAIRTIGQVSIGAPPGGTFLNLGRLAQIRELLKPGLSGKALVFEIMNRQTGETGVLAFTGIAYGSGFGRASVSLSDWTTFTTKQAIEIGDFVSSARIWNASAGLGGGTSASGIVFHGIDIVRDNLTDRIMMGDSLWIGGAIAGTGIDVSESGGMVKLLSSSPYPDGDSTGLILDTHSAIDSINWNYEHPENPNFSNPYTPDMGAQVPDDQTTQQTPPADANPANTPDNNPVGPDGNQSLPDANQSMPDGSEVHSDFDPAVDASSVSDASDTASGPSDAGWTSHDPALAHSGPDAHTPDHAPHDNTAAGDITYASDNTANTSMPDGSEVHSDFDPGGNSATATSGDGNMSVPDHHDSQNSSDHQLSGDHDFGQ